ncbi:beta-1,4-glucuronyltransferase 1-like [Palaemon carinicauda]|uniref:beta-1,4-glucuronyltransferase 1-like n=1 Tax=Palaemon carinicauda TaxID=392227 RepID=UPI0035B6AB5D
MHSSDNIIAIGIVTTLINIVITLVVILIMWNLQGPSSIRKVLGQLAAEEYLQEHHEQQCRGKETVPEAAIHFTGTEQTPFLDHSRGVLDKSGSFKSHPFAITGENWDETCDSWNICLSTQTSADLMFNIAKQAEMWEGPISVAVLTPDLDFTVAIIMMKYLQKCFPKMMTRVALHITYPRHLPPRYDYNEGEERLEYNCKQPESVNKEIVRRIRTRKLTEHIKLSPYPQNLLRNLARQGCPCEFSFTPDIDMISIPRMSKQLNEFVARNSTRECDRCAYIIPIYEIATSVKRNPKTKEHLKKLIKSGLAQRFHIKVFPGNQENSQLLKWEGDSDFKTLDVMYNITSWKEYWEPIYIAKATVPLFDESFVGYGYTRSSQIYEMNYAGYSWFMLNKVFLCHSGFQTKRQRSIIRKKQMRKNIRFYNIFKKVINARYTSEDEDDQHQDNAVD